MHQWLRYSHHLDESDIPPIEIPMLSREELVQKAIDRTLQIFDVTIESELKVEFLTKVSKVSKLRHDNLVELRGYSVGRNQQMLAYEPATMGSLHDILQGIKVLEGALPGETLDWMQRVRIAVDVGRGLKYLHENVQPPITCRYIRSSNVLLFEDFKAKIVYFNLTNEAPDEAEHSSSSYFVRTLGYDPPGYIGDPTESSIVYSFGVLLLELLTGISPFDESRSESLVIWAKPKIIKGVVKDYVDVKLKGKYHTEGVQKLASVAALCVQSTPEYRPNLNIVLRELTSLLKPPTPALH